MWYLRCMGMCTDVRTKWTCFGARVNLVVVFGRNVVDQNGPSSSKNILRKLQNKTKSSLNNSDI